ncbi:MAG: hypothetical protein HY329_04805, partial [Chloroflexi bacterium]|nr:hypothetical protein [Chloroflexota bacterium]
MPNLTIEVLVDRVEALEERNRNVERSNRRWRLAGVGAIALAGLIAAGGAFQVTKVEAEIAQYTGNKYELTDGDGKSRGVFQVSNNGSAGLGFLSSDPNGIPTALVVDKDGN